MKRGKPQRSSSRVVVMIVCHFDDTNEIGGVEKQAALLSTYLSRRGEQVVVLSSTRSPNRAKWSVINDVPTRLFWTYGSPQAAGRHLPAALIWAMQVAAWIIFHRRRIKLIHCHQIRIHSFVGAIARIMLGIPVIHKSGLGGERADIRKVGSRKYFGAPGRRFIINNSDMFIATAESIRKDLREFKVSDNKISLIPNGLRLPDAPARTMAQGEIRILFLGRISSDKNILNLAQAAANVCERGRVVLNIYGKGPQLPDLVKILEYSGSNGVTYCGWVDNVGDVLRNHHYLLLPSVTEGLSNAMIEAMAYGVVPVVSRVSGSVDQIVDGETGFFLRGTDHETLSREIVRLSQVEPDVWARMSGAAMSLARERFDIERVADRYVEIYENLSSHCA
jgi:glycosyltransferase involved in cell wall biosynthesis